MSTQSKPTRYLDPKIDLAFKRVFGEHKNLLKSFLNALLPLPEDAPIADLEYLSPEQAPELPYHEKYSIVDVQCKDTLGRIFIVEMQMLWTSSFEQRIVFGGSQAYVKQLKAGKKYESLQPVYSLALVNTIFEPHTTNYYHHYRIVKAGKPERVLPWLQFIFIELPKFKPESDTDKRMMQLWLRFLNEVGSNTEQTPDPALQNEPDIAQALDLMQASAFNEAELRAYHHNIDERLSYQALMDDAHHEGVTAGLARGKTQRNEEIAHALKAQGVSATVIASATGLSLAEIAAL